MLCLGTKSLWKLRRMLRSRMPISQQTVFQTILLGLGVAVGSSMNTANAADARAKPTGAVSPTRPAERSLLTAAQWAELDRTVDRGLAYLSHSQRPDGSFPTEEIAQPGITSLCVMAFLARGHQPGSGPYRAQLDRAIDYVLAKQQPRLGAIMSDQCVPPDIGEGNYNHGISGVMLAEAYGMTTASRHEAIRVAILKALKYTRKRQLRPKRNPAENGGWRYTALAPFADADLSVSAWQLMFLRAARNAEFNVPEQWVNEGMGFVHRTFDVGQRGFVYGLTGKTRRCSRGTVGAGIVSLALAGEHQSETAKIAGDWILQNSFDRYNDFAFRDDRYHYGAFYCSQAMFQLGGNYWRRFFPGLLAVLAKSQRPDGSWDLERAARDSVFGKAYTTSLALLALTTPYQILPVYQR